MFLKERVSEASTLRAITLLAGLAGWKLSPENGEAIATLVVFGLGFFGLTPDRKKTDAEIALEAKALKEAKIAEAREVLGLPPEE